MNNPNLITILSAFAILNLLAVNAARMTVSRGKVVFAKEQFPFLVLVKFKNNICTGELVSSGSVHTAAHCACGGGMDAKKFTVYPAALDIYDDVEPIGAKEVSVNPKYLSPCALLMLGKPNASIISGHDNAMIKLSKNVDFNKYPQATIAKFDFQDYVLPGTQLIITGYGKDTETTSSLKTGVLKTGSVVAAECPEKRSKSKPVCVLRSANLQNVETGDSGGPIMRKDTLQVVGTVSGEYGFYDEQRKPVTYDIYSSVKTNEEFITSNM